MEEFKKDGDNFIYEDENGVYTFVDMGDYITASRSPLSSAPVIWHLMGFNGKLNNSPITMDALIDRFDGTYSRILINDTIPVFLRNGVMDKSTRPEAQQLANWFINADNALSPKLNEYIRNNQDQHDKTN